MAGDRDRAAARAHPYSQGRRAADARTAACQVDQSASGRRSHARRLAPSRAPFPAIESYAFISDCHTGALVSRDGAVEWMCSPSFDSPSIFGALLDREAGQYRVGPYGVVHPSTRYYVPGTNVVETTYRTTSGWLVVRDALTIGPRPPDDAVTPHRRPPTDEDADHILLRTMECVEGHVEIELVCAPVFDYGRIAANWALTDGDRHRARASAADQTVVLRTDLAMGIEGNRVRARRMLRSGERAFAALSLGDGIAMPTSTDEAWARMGTTVAYWRNWLASARIPDHRWSHDLQRSALAIKGLTYAPTGSAIAALTTSLPETPGGPRNWDYRYAWMRDATFTLQALHWLDLDWEADEFIQFIADLEPNADGGLQIMYGIDGRRDLTESTVEELTGYEGARPVRVGNAAYDQRQNDVYGAVLDSLLLHTRRGQRLPRRLWPIVQAQADCATHVWREPDQGIWEARGAPRHYVSSKLMGWVALDRAA